MLSFYFFFFKQKTAYEMRISDWSSDVCSSDLFFHPFALSLSKGFTSSSEPWPQKKSKGLRQAQPERVSLVRSWPFPDIPNLSTLPNQSQPLIGFDQLRRATVLDRKSVV